MRTLSKSLNILMPEDNPADQSLHEESLASSKLKIRNIFSVSTVKQAKEMPESSSIKILFAGLSLSDSFGIDSLTSIHLKEPVLNN